MTMRRLYVLWPMVPAWLAAGVLVSVRLPALGFPEPEMVSGAWLLDFSADKPRQIAVPDLLGNVHWYWYMTYKVVNHTESEQLLIPEFTITTDRGDIIEAGDNVPTNVFRAVREQVGNPLLESPLQIVGKILRGEDHARESVAIWPAFDHNVDTMSIFVAGLSGETTFVMNPMTHKQMTMRRTLMLEFALPGTGELRGEPLIKKLNHRWIMR